MSKRLVWHKEEVEDVIKLLLSCKTKENMEKVFDRILTPREINDIARRYKALIMIDEGRSYADIHLETGMSKVTITKLFAKCGYGFRKSSGLSRPKKPKEIKRQQIVKYKGVIVAKIKR